jgi:integrase/recombinase XerD
MLDEFVYDPRRAARLRDGVLGQMLDPLTADLHARGYSVRIIQDYVRAVAHFGFWLDASGVAIFSVSPELICDFVERHTLSCCCPVPTGGSRRVQRAALGHLLGTMRRLALMTATSPSSPTPVDGLVSQFVLHCKERRGLSEWTCRQQSRYVRELLRQQFANGAVDASLLTPDAVRSFVATAAEAHVPAGSRCIVPALRGFLRFLALRGQCDSALVCAVPAVAHRPSRLPRCLTKSQIELLLASFERATAVGCRDHCIALCLARLGMRVGEVVALRLDDIDWLSAVPTLLAVGGARFERYAARHDNSTGAR